MQRVQFRRGVKGWSKPAGAQYVGRVGSKRHLPVGTPNYWGNPYTVEEYGREQAIALYRRDVEALTPVEREAWLTPLRKADSLMCWCGLDKACHADVLIEYLGK
jgi:hypothetical protein